MGFDRATWNFVESGHGKGAPDAIGSFLKRHADAVLNSALDITDAIQLFKVLNNEDFRTKLYLIDELEINNMDATYSKQLKVIKGTMKLHQLITDEELCVAYRNLSCFCAQINHLHML